MKLRNKTTGEIGYAIFINADDADYTRTIRMRFGGNLYAFRTMKEMMDRFEDYTPSEPIFDDEKVSKAIRAWLSIQAQPIETVSILCSKDSDGFFCYNLYGYIDKARIVDGKAIVNNHLTAICFYFRSDTYFEHDRRHDYSIAELVGEDEE